MVAARPQALTHRHFGRRPRRCASLRAGATSFGFLDALLRLGCVRHPPRGRLPFHPSAADCSTRRRGSPAVSHVSALRPSGLGRGRLRSSRHGSRGRRSGRGGRGRRGRPYRVGRPRGLCGNRCRDRSRGRARRKEGQRVEVTLVVAREADAEVDEGLGDVDGPVRPHRADGRALRNRLAALHGGRSEVQERRGMTVARLDRHGLAAVRDDSGERHDARDGSHDRCPRPSAEVDATVLSGRVRVCPVERERPQHRAVDGPAPGPRDRHGADERNEKEDSESPQTSPPCCRIWKRNHRSKGRRSLSILATRYGGRARSGTRP